MGIEAEPLYTLAEVLEGDVPGADVTDMIGLQRALVRDGMAAVVTLSRAERLNALTLAGWSRLSAVFAEVAEDDRLRAVILRGDGGRAFGAGADISEFPETRLGVVASQRYSSAISSALHAIEAISLPVIAMIRGLAVGGGCELACACDVRLASNDSQFGIPIGTLGVTLGLAEAGAVSRAIGEANLKFLVFSGELIDAATAYQWGMLQRVVPPESLISATVGLSESIVSSSSVTIRATKEITRLTRDPLAGDDHPTIRELDTQAYEGRYLRESVAAFLQRREP